MLFSVGWRCRRSVLCTRSNTKFNFPLISFVFTNLCQPLCLGAAWNSIQSTVLHSNGLVYTVVAADVVADFVSTCSNLEANMYVSSSIRPIHLQAIVIFVANSYDYCYEKKNTSNIFIRSIPNADRARQYGYCRLYSMRI